MPTFDFLYFFENQQIIILELKRTDSPSGAIKSELYKWLLIDIDSARITLLDFLSMKSGEHRQERFFRQGYLSFDSQHAVYIRESSSVQSILTNRHPEQIPVWVVTFIEEQMSI